MCVYFSFVQPLMMKEWAKFCELPVQIESPASPKNSELLIKALNSAREAAFNIQDSLQSQANCKAQR